MSLTNMKSILKSNLTNKDAQFGIGAFKNDASSTNTHTRYGTNNGVTGLFTNEKENKEEYGLEGLLTGYGHTTTNDVVSGVDVVISAPINKPKNPIITYQHRKKGQFEWGAHPPILNTNGEGTESEGRLGLFWPKEKKNANGSKDITYSGSANTLMYTSGERDPGPTVGLGLYSSDQEGETSITDSGATILTFAMSTETTNGITTGINIDDDGYDLADGPDLVDAPVLTVADALSNDGFGIVGFSGEAGIRSVTVRETSDHTKPPVTVKDSPVQLNAHYEFNEVSIGYADASGSAAGSAAEELELKEQVVIGYNLASVGVTAVDSDDAWSLGAYFSGESVQLQTRPAFKGIKKYNPKLTYGAKFRQTTYDKDSALNKAIMAADANANGSLLAANIAKMKQFAAYAECGTDQFSFGGNLFLDRHFAGRKGRNRKNLDLKINAKF